MSEHKTCRYAAESEENAHIVVQPTKDRLKEAGWRAVATSWSDEVPGYWEEEFKGYFWAHASAGGILNVTYERDLSLPFLPALRAAINAAGDTASGIEEALRRLARITLDTHLPIGQESRFIDLLSSRNTFMGEFLERRLEESPELAQAYRALPARVRLEMERADADAFLNAYGA